jgi:hypothetical protein
VDWRRVVKLHRADRVRQIWLFREAEGGSFEANLELNGIFNSLLNLIKIEPFPSRGFPKFQGMIQQQNP